jgi:hypothetical protein
MMKEILKIKKIRKILLGSFSFLLLLFLPFSFVYGFWEGLANILAAIALFVPLMIGLGFLTISTFFFGIVKDRIFEAPSYTGFDNPIVSFGFPTVQSLGNIIILMGILIVGLATILGIEEYRAQRKLPALIISALFLNFSNVLCGFVVDVSNVLMNEFLKKIGTLDIVWQIIKTNFLSFDTIEKMFSNIVFSGELLLSVVYCFLAGLIIFVLSLLLIIRKVAIPVFVVLAPAAIASYVMPEFPGIPEAFWGHRKFFNWWLQQFLQWCFVGVTVTFFLWLATGYIGNLSKLSFNSPQIDSPQMRVFAKFDSDRDFVIFGDDSDDSDQKPGATSSQKPGASPTSSQTPAEPPPTLKRGNADLNFISTLANYFGVIFMLYMAMQLGFQTSAFGAGAMIGVGQRLGTALRGEVAKRVGAGARRLRTEIGERMAKSERLQKVKDWYKENVPGWAKKTIEGTGRAAGVPIYAVRKAIGMATGFEYAGIVEESKKRFAEAKEKFKKEGADAKKLAQTILNPLMTLEDKVAAWIFAKETGQFGKVIGALREQGADPDRLLVRHIQGIAPINPDLAKLLVKVNPHLAGEIKQGLSKKTAEAIGLKDLTQKEMEMKISFPMKILMQLTPEEFVSVNPEAQRSSVFQDYLASRQISVSQFRAFLEKGDPEAREKFIRRITTPEEKGGLGGWEYYKKIGNEKVWNWIKHSPAVYDLGILSEEKAEAKKLIIEPTEEAFKEALKEAKRRGERFG